LGDGVMMSEPREIVQKGMRWLSCFISCAGAILYVAILIYETHAANEPNLWRDMWKQIWMVVAIGGPKYLALSLVQYSVFFFGGLTLTWRSLPAFYYSSPSISRYAFVGGGVLAIAFVIFFAVSDFFDDYGDFDRGQSLLVFGVIYGFALVLLGRSLPLILVVFRRGIGIFHRLAILAMVFFVLVVLCIGAGGTASAIEAFVEEQYHSA
jgi:hypothetical protein